jgi:hypothetical protein
MPTFIGRARAIQGRTLSHPDELKSEQGRSHMKAFTSQMADVVDFIRLIDLNYRNVEIHPIVMAEFIESGATFTKHKQALLTEDPAKDDRLAVFFRDSRKNTVDPKKSKKNYMFKLAQNQPDYNDLR